jgi:phosphatidylserine decarboxylase
MSSTEYRVGEWLPSDQKILNDWLLDLIEEVATRLLIFIKADNPKTGLMCLVLIGMAELSSCDVTVYEGPHAKKGQSIEMFHFGGSSHCMLFSKDVDVEFDLPEDNPPGPWAYNLFINSKLAIVK